MTAKPKHPGPDERVCPNCRHVMWMVAIGQGLQCTHPAKKPPDKDRFPVPNRWYTCEHFEKRPPDSDQETS